MSCKLSFYIYFFIHVQINWVFAASVSDLNCLVYVHKYTEHDGYKSTSHYSPRVTQVGCKFRFVQANHGGHPDGSRSPYAAHSWEEVRFDRALAFGPRWRVCACGFGHVEDWGVGAGPRLTYPNAAAAAAVHHWLDWSCFVWFQTGEDCVEFVLGLDMY